MYKLIIFCTVVLSSTSQAKEFSLWEVNELNLEYYKYRGQFRDPYFIEQDGSTYKPMRDGAELNMNLSVLKWLYWDNRYHMAMDETSQVRHVGWEWEAGLRLKYIDLFSHHHSRHGLEYINPRGDRFPVEDFYGIRFKFIDRGNK